MRTDGDLGSGIRRFPEAVTPIDSSSDARTEFASLFRCSSVIAMVGTGGGGGGWRALGRLRVAPTRGRGAVLLRVNGSKFSHNRGSPRRLLRGPEVPQDCTGPLAGGVGMLGSSEWGGGADSCVDRKVGSAGTLARRVASLLSFMAEGEADSSIATGGVNRGVTTLGPSSWEGGVGSCCCREVGSTGGVVCGAAAPESFK